MALLNEFVVPRDIRIPVRNGRISFTPSKSSTKIKLDTTQLLKIGELIKMQNKTILVQSEVIYE
jgi:hypothetical protein